MEENDKLLTTKEAAEILGYKPYTLKLARQANKLGGKEPPKVTMLGTTVRYKKSDLLAWIDE